ncbi:MAG TPA: preprotein translocase subunit SecE [Ktedonobacterales bacterium]|nr:preprotein translocase subunit SecE [Ktedonobacterales bacterium]
MAKTIDKAKNAAARAGSRRAASDATPKELHEETPLDAEDAALNSADEADGEEEEDLSLEVDPTAAKEDESSRALAPSGERRVAGVSGTGGIYVPAPLMRNPITRWLAEAYIELRKVTWPETRDAWNMTLVVIVVSVVMAGLLAAADFGLGHLLTYFVSLGLGK